MGASRENRGERVVQRRREDAARETAMPAVQRVPAAALAEGAAPETVASLDAQLTRLQDALAVAARGTAGGGGSLPHGDAIQRSFGHHDVTDVPAHVGGPAAEAADQLGARAWASGGRVAFRQAPDLHTAAHEAAHVVQQRAGATPPGGLDTVGDAWERHADTVADRVVAGGDAAPLLDQVAGGVAGARGVAAASGAAVQREQDPAAARQSRVTVATSTQAFRPTYADEQGGQLTQRLLRQLENAQTSVADAVGTVGAGDRTFGSRPGRGEERAGTGVGATTPAETVVRRAVVVGNGDYDENGTMGNTVESLRDIDGATSEAAAVATAFQGRGYDVRHQDNQTGSEIATLLTDGLTGLTAGSELAFYYHGHGTPEGLIGRDGSVYTPAQLTALRGSARSAQVDLTLALEGCHTGVFADAIRGAELGDTRAAAQARAGAATGEDQAALQALVPLLDAALAVQQQKDAFTTSIQAWWARRYEIERDMAAAPDDMSLIERWSAHYETAQGIWNDFVTAVTPLVATLRSAATTATMTLGEPRVRALSGSFNQDGEQAIQAGLDDLDTILNQVLTESDARLR